MLRENTSRLYRCVLPTRTVQFLQHIRFQFFSEQAVDRKQAIMKQGRANKKLMPNKGCRRNRIRKVTSNCKQRRNILTTTEEKKRTHNSRTVYKTNDTLAGPAKTPKELNRNRNNKRHELTSQGVGKLCWAPMLDW